MATPAFEVLAYDLPTGKVTGPIKVTRAVLEPARIALYFTDTNAGDRILFGGILWTPSGSGTDTITLDGQGVLSYYGNGETGRLVEPTSGVSEDFTTTDPMVIVSTLITNSKYSTTGFPYDPLNLTVVRHGTGSPITVSYPLSDQRFIRDVIEELATGRFEFWVEYDWNNGTPTHTLQLWWGTRGLLIPNTLDLEVAGVSLDSWAIDGFARADDVYTQGNGATGRATNDPPYAYPFTQKTVSLPNTRASTLLDHHAAWELDRASSMPLSLTVSVTDPDVLSVGDFTIGDRVMIAGPIGTYQYVEETFRIEQATVTAQGNSVNKIQLQLASGNPVGPPVLSLAQQEESRVDQLAKALQNLSNAVLP
jgi:hypothetical protein